MPLEADVAFLHVAGGGARLTPPPGCLALTAPRRAARARGEDLLFLCLNPEPASALSPAQVEHAVRVASEAFYGTPGSVTAALRELAYVANGELVEANQGRPAGDPVQARLFAGVLRGDDLYLAQCGPGQAVLVRPGLVSRLGSEEAASRPLGITEAPFVRFHHIEAHPHDLLLLTTADPPLWSDPTLSGLSGMDPARAVDRLAAASQRDMAGVLVRLTAPGASLAALPSASAAVPSTAVRPASSSARPPQRASGAGRPAHPRRAEPRPTPAWVRQIRSLQGPIERGAGRAAEAVTSLIIRMAPGLAEGPKPGTLSPRLLAATAIVIPILVVSLSAAVYFRRGRTQAFRDFLTQAQSAVVSAQIRPTAAESRADWELAEGLLSDAARYGASDDSRALRAQVDLALDQLNLVSRLDFRPAVSGGFGSQVRITGLAATASDLFVLDAGQASIWHAWATGRGYEIDRTFECLGTAGVADLGPTVDLVIQHEPGALGAEGVVAVDAAGGLLYCAADRRPASGHLTPPDAGWGTIAAVDLFANRLYVLDPQGNQVWSFDATGGLFAGPPSIYFVDNVPDLSTAVDIAVAEDELFILFSDGRLDRCRRERDDSSGEIHVTCENGVPFIDQRAGFEGLPHVPGVVLGGITYSPPPEPSLYFLDATGPSLFHYSLRLVFQGLLMPRDPLGGPATAFALGPPNDLFLAVGSQVYFAQPIP
ncbi:MAG: hypothetical protein WD906_01350 [Anaerolineales bacterium]